MALNGGIYLGIIRYCYGGPNSSLTIVLPGGLYLAIIMHRYGEPQTAFAIVMPAGLYLAIRMYRSEGPLNCPYYSLSWRPLLSHYNGPL
jgi:hypothetical protein